MSSALSHVSWCLCISVGALLLTEWSFSLWRWNKPLWLLAMERITVAVVNVTNLYCQALLNQLELSLASIVTLFHGKTAQGAPLLPQHAIERRKTSLHVHDAVPPAPMLTRVLTLCCCAHSVYCAAVLTLLCCFVLCCCCVHSTLCSVLPRLRFTCCALFTRCSV